MSRKMGFYSENIYTKILALIYWVLIVHAILVLSNIFKIYA